MSSSTPLYRLEQPASRASAFLSLAVLSPAACSILIPIGLVAAHASDVAASAGAHPIETLQVAAGLLCWILLFVLPLAKRTLRAGVSQSLTIADGRVIETTQTLFRARATTKSLSEFSGIAHRIRTTVGSVTHELALIERHGAHRVVFQIGPRLDRADIEAASKALGLPELREADVSVLPKVSEPMRVPAPRPAVAAA